MEVNTTLINQTNNDLTILSKITTDKEMDKEIVLDKLEKVIRQLNELNTIQQSSVKELSQNKEKWKQKMDKFDKAHEAFNTQSVKAGELVDGLIKAPPDESIKIANELTNILNDKTVDEQLPDLIIDHILLTDIISQVMHNAESKVRKRWLLKNKFIFRNLNLLTKLLTILIAFTFGFICETLAKFLFPNSPDYLIGLAVLVISYFTTDKFLEKISGKFFWKQAKRETLILVAHLRIYMYQTSAILDFIIKMNKIS